MDEVEEREPDSKNVDEQRWEIIWTVTSLLPAGALMWRTFATQEASIDVLNVALFLFMSTCLYQGIRRMCAVPAKRPIRELEIGLARPRVGSRADARACSIFLEAVADPSFFVRRVKERVSPLSRAYLVQVQHEVTFPADSNFPGESLIYFPLLITRKGALRDDLRISVNGASQASATFEESVSIFEDACVSVLGQAERWWDKILVSSQSGFRAQEFLDVAVSLVSSRVGGDKDAQRVAYEQRVAFAEQLRAYLAQSRVSPGERELLGQVIAKLANHYVVCVPLLVSGDSDSHWVIDTEERVLPSVERFGPADTPATRLGRLLSWCVSRAQRIYGLRSGRIEYFPDRAYDCNSYHLEVMGAPGTFLMRQDLYPEARVSGYWRFRRRQGQRYGHFYSRGLRLQVGQLLAQRDPRVLFRYRERTPGYYAPAAISALIAFLFLAIAWPMAFLADSKGTDVMALLIAAPGAVIGWSGVDQRSNHVGISTAPRVIASLTVLVSLAGAAQFLLQRNRPLLAPQRPFDGPLVLDANFSWAAILTSAGLLACAGIYAWLRAAMKESMIVRLSEKGK